MPGFFSFWRRDDNSLPLPSTTKDKSRHIEKAAIGRPVLRSLPRRFEIYAPGEYTRDPLTRSSSHRSGSLPSPSGSHPSPSPPAAHFTPPGRDKSPYPLIRSYSLPIPACSAPSEPTHPGFDAPPAARANSFSPLHLDTRRPLSPIQEQTCASPISIKPTSPKDSEISTLDLARPVARLPPFVRRTLSKSGTSGSTTLEPPSLPPLNLCPPFPGPHPSQDGDGPPRRPPRVFILPVPSIIYSEGAPRSSSGSLHAESFVTASDSLHNHDTTPLDAVPLEQPNPVIQSATSSSSSIHSSHAEPSPAYLERNGTACSVGSSHLRLRRQHFTFATPAFCAFWLGFLFWPLWWVGGWYFTFFPETPASRTLWEHYVFDTQWWAVLTCGCRCQRRRKRRDQAKHASDPEKPLLLPQWVGRNNTTASLKGISYYYPYVSRPAPGEKGHVTTSPPPAGFRWLHKWFDEVTRSRLAQVKANHESPRRIIDPWIQRCRRALCYCALLVLLFILGMMGWSFAVGAGKTHY
ncbi:hypothetical protein MVEN_01778700 [Mycena venus]|uniref:Uncharacterized protein n=1 Tax=Mycena venus TaxID=2733690 RepID=A0A8H6XN76_9AGAR|nr:hypothetical protein MVEN_01778700 [Mycena venus]